MGFVSGFTGGVTLTLGLAYLTVLSHERNRTAQALHLRSQSALLTSILEPPATTPAPLTRAEIARQERSTISERAKDRWNDEIQRGVHFVQTTDWSAVRENMEGAVARALGLGLQKGREGIEEGEAIAKPYLDEAGQKAEELAQKAKNEGHRLVNDAAKGGIRAAEESKVYAESAAAKAKAGLDQASMKAGQVSEAARKQGEKAWKDAKAGADQAGVKAQEVASDAKVKANRAAADVKAAADGAATSTKTVWGRGVEKAKEKLDKANTEVVTAGPGTVEAIRSTVRGTVSKGIEKGKALVGKAQEAVSVATDKVGSAVTGAAPALTAEEKALRQRYEQPRGMNQTVEEALAARYTPIDARDNTQLRGV